MTKHAIAVLIAGGLLAAQFTLANADQGPFPSSVNETYTEPLPATIQYLQQRGATDPNPKGAAQPVFPVTAATGGGGAPSTPSLNQYLAGRAKTTGPGYSTVKITASTPSINVEHLQRVEIQNDKGQSFVWRADELASGADNFPLKAVAPNDFAAGSTWVYLSHPHEHMLHN